MSKNYSPIHLCNISLLFIIILLITISFASKSYAQLAWPSNGTEQGNWFPVTINGIPFRDYEINDLSSSAGTNGNDDIASGYNGTNGSQANCNPDYGPAYTCGPLTSAYFYCDDRGNADPTDDWVFYRMRVNGNPTTTGGGAPLANGKWNFLIDVSDDPGGKDGYKDYWFLLDGNTDTLSIRYDDMQRQNIPAGQGIVTRTFTYGLTPPRFFRALRILGSPGSGGGSNPKNEWYIDVQAPARCFTDMVETNAGCNPNIGTQLLSCDVQAGLLFSTSDSNTDPLQKDFIPNCPDVSQPCNFSDSTPITLSFFKASSTGGGVKFNWTTSTETGNAGFNLYAQGQGGMEKLNPEPILSNVVNSLYPEDYEYVSPDTDSTKFIIADIDITGKEKMHGPYNIDTEYGSKETTENINWDTINSKRMQKELDRTIFLKNSALTKSNKLKNKLNSLVKSNNIQEIQAALPSVDISVVENGIYGVTYEDLLSLGADFAGVPSSDIALTNFANPVQIYVSSAGNTFGPGSYIEFYGEGYKTLYTDKNVYILSVDPSLAQRVSIDDKTTKLKNASASYNETTVIDNNNNYYIGSPADPWYDTRFQATKNSPISKTIDFDVDNLASSGGSIALTLIGGIDYPNYIDHHFIVELNDVKIAENTFDGVRVFVQKIDLSNTTANLHNGTNQLKLSFPGDNAPIDIEYLDKVSITYPRLYSAKNNSLIFDNAAVSFSVTNLASPNAVVYSISDSGVTKINSLIPENNGPTYKVSFAGDKTKEYRYVVSTVEAIPTPDIQLSEPFTDITSGSAEYLIISHPDFIDELADLENERQIDYSVKMVNVNDIYAQFSNSIFDPNGIKEYIKYAYENMGTRFVLLVGADTYDYLDYLGVGSYSFIPTLYAKTNPFVSYGPSDSLLADVNGDKVQDLAIGRFPVRTSSDLDLVIQKTLLYPTTKNKKAVFSADIDDGGTSFSDQSDEFADFLSDDWTVDKAYMQEIGVAAAKSILVNSLNETPGSRAFTSFVGHSSFGTWSFTGLFNQTDAMNLTNTDNPTVVAQFGCWNTYFVEPKVNTMAHRFLLSGTNGASLVTGPSGLASDNSQERFGKLFYENIFSGMTMGEAVLEAKQSMAGSSGTFKDDVIIGWNLLGDPALVVTD